MSTTQLRTIGDLLAMGSDAQQELIEGVLHAVSPSGGKSSEIAITIAGALLTVVRAKKLGRVTGEQGGYILSRNPDSVAAPDVAFIANDRLPLGMPSGFINHAPDFAVEVMSPSDRWAEIDAKARWYVDKGVLLVWVVDPTNRTVSIYREGRAEPDMVVDGAVDAAPVIPDFAMAIDEIFA